MAMLGIAVIVGWGYDGRPDEWQGIALGLASGLVFAVVSTSLRGLRHLDPIWLSAVFNLSGGLALGLGIAVSGRAIGLPTAAASVHADSSLAWCRWPYLTSCSLEACARSARPKPA